FQTGVDSFERVDGLTKQRGSTVTAGHHAGGTQGDAKRARAAECPRMLKLLFCQPLRGFEIAERQIGERSIRSPGDVTRAGHHRACQAYPYPEEVREPFGDSSLGDPQPAAG